MVFYSKSISDISYSEKNPRIHPTYDFASNDHFLAEKSKIEILGIQPKNQFRPALDSGLSVGDQLLQVDGQSLISVTHLNAIRFLKGKPFTQKTINSF